MDYKLWSSLISIKFDKLDLKIGSPMVITGLTRIGKVDRLNSFRLDFLQIQFRVNYVTCICGISSVNLLKSWHLMYSAIFSILLQFAQFNRLELASQWIKLGFPIWISVSILKEKGIILTVRTKLLTY